MKQLLISVLLLLTYWTMYAQEKKNINASDGTIDAYVEVTWVLSSPCIRYEIIRSETGAPSKGKVVDIDTLQKGLFGDRQAVRGMKYIYKGKLHKASGEVVDIGFDIGWRPPPPPIAIKQVRYDAELFTSSRTVTITDSIVIAQPEITGKWRPNQSVAIKTVLRNTGYNRLSDISVKIFISDDTLLDGTDKLISEIAVDKGLNADITELDEAIKLPKGNYKNKNLILAVTQGQEVKAITIRPL